MALPRIYPTSLGSSGGPRFVGFWTPSLTVVDPEVPYLPLETPAAGGFPTQFAGLRTFYGAAMKELCLVANADAPSGMGAVWRILKGAVTYAVYLVETTDPNASSVRIKTSTGIKAVRLKT